MADDYISRTDLKYEMIRYGFSAPNMTVTEFIEALPFVQLQRPNAKFILVGNNPNFSPFDNSSKYILKCSNCLNKVLDSFMYCPNCGAKMIKN